MKHIDHGRRQALRQGGTVAVFGLFVAAGLFRPGSAHAAWNQAAFAAKNVDGVVKGMGGASAAPTKDVSWGSTPEIAENGAVVPIEVTSKIAGTSAIMLLVEKNPSPLTANFDLSNGADSYVSTRIKMGQTSNVRAVVKAGGKSYTAIKEVKVTIGGCGG